MKYSAWFGREGKSVQNLNFLDYLRNIRANAQELEGYMIGMADGQIKMFVDFDGTFAERVGTIQQFEIPFVWNNHTRTGNGETDYVCLFTNDELDIFRQLCNLVTVVFVTRRKNEDTRRVLTAFRIPDSVQLLVVPEREVTKASRIVSEFGEMRGARIIIIDDLEKEITDYRADKRLGNVAEIIQPRYL